MCKGWIFFHSGQVMSSLVSKLAGGHQVPAPRCVFGGSQRPGELPGKKCEHSMLQGTTAGSMNSVRRCWGHRQGAAVPTVQRARCGGEEQEDADPAAPTHSAGLSLLDRSLQKFWALLIMDNAPKKEAHQKQRTPFMAQPGRLRGLPYALGDHRGRHSCPGQCFNTPLALHYHSYSGACYSCASNRTN